MTPSHPDRQRPHEEPHIRHIDVQTLDALIRIEELLTKLVEAGAVRVQDEVKVDLSNAKQAELVKTAPKPAPRRNPRQL